MRLQRHSNRYLQNAWNKYGPEAFVFEVLDETLEDDCLKQEIVWCNSIRPEFNALLPNGDENHFHPSQETRRRMSDALRRRFADPVERAKLSEKTRCRYADPVERQKLKDAMNRPEVLAKNSSIRKGRKPSPETRLKMSAAGKRRWQRDIDFRKKRSQDMKARYQDPEERKKTSKQLIGRPCSGATRKKLSEKQKSTWSNPKVRANLSVEKRMSAAKRKSQGYGQLRLELDEE